MFYFGKEQYEASSWQQLCLGGFTITKTMYRSLQQESKAAGVYIDDFWDWLGCMSRLVLQIEHSQPCNSGLL